MAYRLGGLSLEELEEAIGPVELRLNQSSNPAAPGMLTTHYAPRKPLLIGQIGPSGALLDENGAPLEIPASVSRIGLLRFKPGVAADARVTFELSLTEAGDLLEAARHIFGALRALDQADVELIVAETCPDEGLGRAVNDRLRRAAA